MGTIILLLGLAAMKYGFWTMVVLILKKKSEEGTLQMPNWKGGEDHEA